MNYLIGYDITEPKRLQKVHQRLIKYATAIQYSVFLRGNKQWLKKLPR
ncbi:TPA: CRISPR-associated endonuclease Cas2 [Mannheimia haemolytica]